VSALRESRTDAARRIALRHRSRTDSQCRAFVSAGNYQRALPSPRATLGRANDVQNPQPMSAQGDRSEHRLFWRNSQLMSTVYGGRKLAGPSIPKTPCRSGHAGPRHQKRPLSEPKQSCPLDSLPTLIAPESPVSVVMVPRQVVTALA